MGEAFLGNVHLGLMMLFPVFCALHSSGQCCETRKIKKNASSNIEAQLAKRDYSRDFCQKIKYLYNYMVLRMLLVILVLNINNSLKHSGNIT